MRDHKAGYIDQTFYLFSVDKINPAKSKLVLTFFFELANLFLLSLEFSLNSNWLL